LGWITCQTGDLNGRPRVRRGPGTLYRKAKSLEYWATRDRAAALSFLTSSYPVKLDLPSRLRLLAQLTHITNHVRGYHTQAEMLRVIDRILARADRPDLVVVECGVAKGSSTAKLSLATRAARGRLLAFDSFRGIPPNVELHRHLDGRSVRFHEGAFTGRLASVERVVAEHGAPEHTTLIKGWFADTLAALPAAHVDVALLDVDLLSSTRTCVRALWPKLRRGGVLFTQDGHLEAIVQLLGDPAFWRDEVGVEPPSIPGLGRDKLLEIVRP
jgi:O-methyltransferase